jgi:hypothetical protein
MLHAVDEFKPGARCEIIKVGHRLWEKDIGKRVIIASVNPEMKSVWAYDDAPAKYRTNRNGKQVTVFNPKSVHTIYGMDQLRIISQSA